VVLRFFLSRFAPVRRPRATIEEPGQMDRHDQRRLTDQLLPALLAAARLEMGYFNAGCAVDTKADSSPVTIADQQAEATILAALGQILPGVAVVAEEAFAAGARPALTEPFVLVDALDGTKQFVAGFREFTINIALVRGGVPIYGLVYAPALGDLLVTDGPGATLRARFEPGADLADLAAARPQPARVRTGHGGVTVLQSRSRDLAASDRYLEAFDVRERRRLGSSYKFCLIAAGEADIYPQLGDTREWDTAAGQAVLEGAGGVVARLDGGTLTYGKRSADYLNSAFVASCAPLETLRMKPAAVRTDLPH
jgi:3'(2'), 5'-bisphosphate nucleotidase